MNYFGDVNIEHGGVFYTLKGYRDGYVSAVRVTACSDAGGPDNCFWMEHLTLYGELDANSVRQSLLHAPVQGDGLADAFNLGRI